MNNLLNSAEIMKDYHVVENDVNVSWLSFLEADKEYKLVSIDVLESDTEQIFTPDEVYTFNFEDVEGTIFEVVDVKSMSVICYCTKKEKKTKFKCAKYNYPELEKRIQKVCKKLDKCGKTYQFKVLNESIEILPVYNHYNVKIGTEPIEVVNYHFEMEELKLGDYEILAYIEHCTPTNLIYTFQEGLEDLTKDYRIAKGNCQHCGTKHNRKKTYLVKSISTAEIKQIGSSCLNEYIGIDALKVIGAYGEIKAICLEDITLYEGEFKRSNLIDTFRLLKASISVIKKVGYDKYSIKEDVADVMQDNLDDTLLNEEAKKVVEHFKSLDLDNLNEFTTNVVLSVTKEYQKGLNGLVIYAYELFKKMTKVVPEVNESKHLGGVKDKLSNVICVVNKSKFLGTNIYGGSDYVNEFVTESGDVITWFTCKGFDEGSKCKLKGTVKALNEFKGIKQTIMTRCKVEII